MRLPEVVSAGDYLMFNAVKVRQHDMSELKTLVVGSANET